MLSKVKRLADPYRDLDVIDSRAARFNQATIGLLSAIATVTGLWWLLGILGAQLIVGLTLGRRPCLPRVVARLYAGRETVCLVSAATAAGDAA